MSEWTPPNKHYPPPKLGEPELHRAARTGDHTAIRLLAAQGADLESVFDMGLDPSGYDWPATPLMIAAGSGDGATIETIELLLELGADPQRTFGKRSAATFACTGLGWNYQPGGDAQRLHLLLEKGAPLSANPSDANQILCDAACSGDSERVRILLEHGLPANGHWDAEQARSNHQQLLEKAEELYPPDPDLFEGMPDEIREIMSETAGDIEAEIFERLASAPSNYEIPLFRAAESGDAESVRVLINSGADVTCRDSSGRTAMYFAASELVVRALMDAGLLIEDADEYGWSPLVNALSDGEEGVPVLKALLACGADVNGTHDQGFTVLMSAVGSMERDISVIRALVEAGADPHQVSELGHNAFHAAIDVNGEANEEESVRSTLGYLKEIGVDIECRHYGDQTPLARAIDEGTGTEVRVLCELGADSNAVCSMHQCGEDSCGFVSMPLLFAAATGTGVDKDEKVAALLNAGADPLVINLDGHTPFVSVVSALCNDADEYEVEFQRFYDGLESLRLEGAEFPQNKGSFINQAMSRLDQFVRGFARSIPVQKTCQFDDQWREERIKCIVLLGAHEAWARWENHRSSDRNEHQ